MTWTSRMASLVGLGTKEGEKQASDLAPLTGQIPSKREEALKELEKSFGSDLQIDVKYRKTSRSPIRSLILGEEYERDDERIYLLFTAPRGAMIGIRRYGENDLGIFDRTTWMPSAAVNEKSAKPFHDHRRE